MAGLFLLLGSNPYPRDLIETAFPYSAFGYYTGDFVVAGGLILGMIVFPGVMTLAARRHYALWGLLPMLVLTLWLMVGLAVAHTLSDLPWWILPLFCLLGWVIAVLPLASIRVVKRTRKPRPNSPSKPIVRPFFRRAIIVLTAAPFAALFMLGWRNVKDPPAAHTHVNFTWSSGKAARVPLVEKYGGIYVVASLNGQQQLCLVDTGLDIVDWPRYLHIPGRLSYDKRIQCDTLDNCVPTVRVDLPRLSIGSFTVTGLPTQMLNFGYGLFTPQPRGETPVLGNAVFASTVLTIDHRYKIMVIRPPSYDFRRKPLSPGARVVRMGWAYHDDEEPGLRRLLGWPVMRARIEGKPFFCVIDTGWKTRDVGIAEGFYEDNPALRRCPARRGRYNATHGSAEATIIKSVGVQVPCLRPRQALPISLHTSASVAKDMFGGDGAMGMALMERYRITIDYQRHRILLEPYPPLANTKRGRNPTPR